MLILHRFVLFYGLLPLKFITDSSDIYEVWDLPKVAIPARSTLYTLKPVGVGTAFVESLTSYIARLADAHCVFSGRLMEKVVVPLTPGYSLQQDQHYLFKRGGERSNLLNATEPRALYAVQSLETLTSRNDLRHLTLLILADVLFIRNLIRLEKAWCPVCYHEWRTQEQVIYDPLLWVLREIKVCVLHKQRLQTHCPYQDCQHVLPALAWRSQPSYCTYCQRWLGTSLEDTQASKFFLEDAELMWHQWATDALGSLLAKLPTVPSAPKQQQVSEVLTHVAKQILHGNVAALARTIKLNIPLMGRWTRGERIPQMDTLLQFCYGVGLSPSEVLFNDPSTLQPCVREVNFSRSRQSHVSIDWERLRLALEKALASEEYPPPSLAEVARRLGYRYGVLYQCHQVACYAISARYKTYLHQQRESRLQRCRTEIQQIATQLRMLGISPSPKRIAAYLSQPSILREPKVREILRDVCRELEAINGEPLQ